MKFLKNPTYRTQVIVVAIILALASLPLLVIEAVALVASR